MIVARSWEGSRSSGGGFWLSGDSSAGAVGCNTEMRPSPQDVIFREKRLEHGTIFSIKYRNLIITVYYRLLMDTYININSKHMKIWIQVENNDYI